MDSSSESEVLNSIIEIGLERYVLEVFDTARYAQPIARARTDYPFIVQTEASDMSLGSVQRRKRRDHQKVVYANRQIPERRL